ncbi:MAG TPA: hypothetical protein VFK79_12550 [Xanthobacteraceae bacterium]|nr:hypothetical protein [Xanthobacteraceae bacterium]
MRKSQLVTRLFAIALLAIPVSILSSTREAPATDDGLYKTANGLSVYLGMVPAEIVKGPLSRAGEQPMHGRIPKGAHQYHLVAAVFDAASGARISDVSVTAQVSGLTLSGPTKRLDPMQIADTITYGTFVNLPGPDLYTVRVTVERPGGHRPVAMDFTYDHRRY